MIRTPGLGARPPGRWSRFQASLSGPRTLVLGLMSGTSADGVDAVLAEFSGPVRRPRWRILNSASLAYPPQLRQELVAIGQGQASSAAALLELAEAVTEAQAAAARACDPRGQAQLVGCHGQTLWHRPPSGDGQAGGQRRRGASWQLLQAPLLASLLQTPVVSDFRAADLALGGQGAPLVPPCDEALVGRIGGWRALLNLGGIANLTLLPPARGPDRHQPVRGWDCGPANSLLDLAVHRFSGGKLAWDAGGAWARRGQIDEQLIQHWLQSAYFQQVPPKSTGRELFGASDLEARLADLGRRAASRGLGLEAADTLATLTAFSAAVVAQDLSGGPKPLEMLVAGGGARNQLLMEQLQWRCRGTAVRPLAELGIEDEQREALAFALLAWWHLLGQPGSAPAVTGASRESLLGVWTRP